MNKETTELIWHNLSTQFKNKVDAYAMHRDNLCSIFHSTYNAHK